MDILALLEIRDEPEFRARFGHTPLRRPKLRGMLRNALVVLGNQMSNKGAVLDHDRVARAIDDAMSINPDSIVREHAVWALMQSESAYAREIAHKLVTQESDILVKAEMLGMLM